MRIARPLLIVTTPLGVVWGLLEAHRLAGGLVFLMAVLVLFMSAAIGMVVHTIRREKREEITRAEREALAGRGQQPAVPITTSASEAPLPPGSGPAPRS